MLTKRDELGVVIAVLLGVGVLSAGTAIAQESLHLYGPLGTNMAIEEAAVAYSSRSNVGLEVVSGPTADWLDRAVQDGDLIFCTGDFIMSDFARKDELAIDDTSLTALYVRPSVMLVRPGNPKDVRDFPDLLRPGMKVMMVNASGQTGLWENITGKLQSLPTLVALEKNIVLCAADSEEALRAWKERTDIDAWIAWNVWHIPRRDLAEVVPMSKDYRIYRRCSIAVADRARSNPAAGGFVRYLASAEGAEIFESWGWMQPPPDANPALADNGVYLACRIAQDAQVNEVGRGLKRLERLVKDYRSLGVPDSEIHICAVFDADAGYWMLGDAAYAAYTKKSSGNPNRTVIEKLLAKGVELELSAEIMKKNGWTQSDLLPDIDVVPEVGVRLAKLGSQGYDVLPF